MVGNPDISGLWGRRHRENVGISDRSDATDDLTETPEQPRIAEAEAGCGEQAGIGAARESPHGVALDAEPGGDGGHGPALVDAEQHDGVTFDARRAPEGGSAGRGDNVDERYRGAVARRSWLGERRAARAYGGVGRDVAVEGSGKAASGSADDARGALGGHPRVVLGTEDAAVCGPAVGEQVVDVRTRRVEVDVTDDAQELVGRYGPGRRRGLPETPGAEPPCEAAGDVSEVLLGAARVGRVVKQVEVVRHEARGERPGKRAAECSPELVGNRRLGEWAKPVQRAQDMVDVHPARTVRERRGCGVCAGGEATARFRSRTAPTRRRP